MKTIFYISSIILLITSCNPQDKKNKDQIITVDKPQPVKHTTMENEYDYKKLISSRTEYFDIKKFYDNNADGLGKTYETNRGNLVEESAGKHGSWFMMCITPKNSAFTIHKEYNYKGLIRQKWVNFRNDGVVVGIKYEFDETGKLISEIDTDLHFKITPQDVIKYCLKKNIDLFSFYTDIDRFIEEKSKQGFYNITYRGKYGEKIGSKIIIQINSTTGEISRVICINGRDSESVEIFYDAKAEKQKKEEDDNTYFTTYKGKDYTKKEWEVFKEEWHKNHEENKNKGFWDDVFPQRKK